MKYIDMHVHTTASDGKLSPQEIIDYAKSKGLAGVGITDHDTIAGLEAAISYGNKKGMIVIPGIELSTEYKDEEIHILGYRIDCSNKELLNTLKILHNERSIRAEKIIQRLNDIGFKINFEDIREISQEGVIGRPHIARALINKGYLRTVQEAFDKYLNKGCPAYVPRYKLSPFDAVDLLKRAGGIAVIAHPGLIKNRPLVKELIDYGVDGIEVYHPEHSREESRLLLELAVIHGRLVTGGSDFHSPPSTAEARSDLGAVKIALEELKAFI